MIKREESKAIAADAKSSKAGAVSPPQVMLLLDENAKLVCANASPAKTFGNRITDAEGLGVHDALHTECSDDCPFNVLWLDAWTHFNTRSLQEWEYRDPVLDKLLRLNLARPPSTRRNEIERRSIRAILTIKDITRFRDGHEALIKQKTELLRLIDKQVVDLSETRQRLTRERESHDRHKELLTESQRKLRSLARQLTHVQENERRRIASDLHDGIAQRLGVIKYNIETCSEQLRAENSDLDISMLDETVEQIKNTVEELRRISSNLSPSQLDDYGLRLALEMLCQDFETQFPDIEFRHRICLTEIDIPELIKITIYRVVQEAVHNIAKHARPTSPQLCLEQSDTGIVLTVSDDGCGFGAENVESHMPFRFGSGLTNMRERVETTIGEFQIDTRPGHGTCIRASWSAEVVRLLGSGEPVCNGVSRDGRDAV